MRYAETNDGKSHKNHQYAHQDYNKHQKAATASFL
jgi:hypothetical protein